MAGYEPGSFVLLPRKPPALFTNDTFLNLDTLGFISETTTGEERDGGGGQSIQSKLNVCNKVFC